jgi:hypothetical protein
VLPVAVIEIRFQLTQHFLGNRAQRDGFVLLIAFLGAFLFIRTSARLMRSPKVPWWPGSVETSGGLHIHHLVWGIVLLLLSGFLGFALDPKSPWSEILAAGFGIGAGLTLDEFALWVRLEDVYWSQEGRESVDAVIVAALIGGLILVGLAPFDTGDTTPGIELLIVILIDVSLCALAAIKGRLLLALLGVFLPPFSLWGAFRLAAPKSPWARWRYKAASRKLDRSYERFRRAHARHRRVIDLIGGSPEITDASAAVALAQPDQEESK